MFVNNNFQVENPCVMFSYMIILEKCIDLIHVSYPINYNTFTNSRLET